MGWHRLLAILVLLPTLCSAQDSTVAPYDRSEWGRWKTTGERGPNGCRWDSRHTALRIAGAAFPETLVIDDERGKACRVRALTLVDRYTGVVSTVAAKDVEVDHVVPLSEAHRSGGSTWGSEKRSLFMNDPENHVATLGSVNSVKSDRDPGGENYRGGVKPWLPPDPAAHCWYAERWIYVKQKWGLSSDDQEQRALCRELLGCPTMDYQAQWYLLRCAFAAAGIPEEDFEAWARTMARLTCVETEFFRPGAGTRGGGHPQF